MVPDGGINRDELILIRPGEEADYAFVYSTWLQNLRHSNDWFKLIDAEVYYPVYHKVVERILETPFVRLKVACLKEDPTVILGYSVSNQDTLHWVHVRKSWRSIGIAKSLVPSSVKTVTHVNKLGMSYLLSHPGQLSFNPFLISGG